MMNHEINVALLREVQAAILETPMQFFMGEWSIGDVVPGAQDKTTASACIGGWAVVLGCRVRLSRLRDAEIRRLAIEQLNLNDEQADRLFVRGLWPWELQTVYLSNPKTLEDYEHNARIAARRIEVFIETGGAL